MKKLDKYLISGFFTTLLGSLIFMLGLYIISVSIDNLKYFSNPNVPFKLVSLYILNIIPGISVQVLPVAVLFSTLYIFGNLNFTNEIIAIYNGRIRFTRLISPLIIIGILLSIFSFLFFEFVSTDTSNKAFIIRNQIKRLTGKSLNYMYARSEFFLLGKDNTFYYIDLFEPEHGIMLEPVLFRFDNRNVMIFQLYAKIGQYDKIKKMWNFSDVKIIRFDEHGKIIKNRLASYSMELYESPKSFIKTPVSFMQMRLDDALKFIEAKKRVGGNCRKYLVEFQWRFAFPFSIIIVILIGSVAGTYFKRAVLVLSFLLSIIISFGYYGILAVGLAFGKAGRLNPIAAAWLANIIYTFVGLIVIRMKR